MVKIKTVPPSLHTCAFCKWCKIFGWNVVCVKDVIDGTFKENHLDPGEAVCELFKMEES